MERLDKFLCDCGVGTRSQVKILIGGLCTGEYQREWVGADEWAYDPMETVNFCKKVIGEKYGQKT